MDRFVPRDDGLAPVAMTGKPLAMTPKPSVTARSVAKRQSMDRFVPRDDGKLDRDDGKVPRDDGKVPRDDT
jgi:hypothetical protein